MVSSASGALGDADALLRVGAFDRALAMAQTGTSLFHTLAQAQVTRAQSDWSSALSTLRAAVADAAEDDPGYVEMLVEMAELSAGTGKLRAARRLLDEVEDIEPSHQTARVASIRRGLSLLKR
jgi:ATP/maltotriose-dependent transcriptional regulator MalT